MNKNKKNSHWNMPSGKLVRVEDFLPPPHELASAEKTMKITISLNKSNIEFFKRQAKKHKTKYQRMIRHILDLYMDRYKAA